jgi:hypothetical protein
MPGPRTDARPAVRCLTRQPRHVGAIMLPNLQAPMFGGAMAGANKVGALR